MPRSLSYSPLFQAMLVVQHAESGGLELPGLRLAPFEVPGGTAKFDLTTDAPLLIGAGAGDYFRGALADVRLYRRALGAEEIGELRTP